MRDIATATLSGNLTRDVELRALPSGADLARLRVATTTRRRSGEEWVEKTNYSRSAPTLCRSDLPAQMTKSAAGPGAGRRSRADTGPARPWGRAFPAAVPSISRASDGRP
jgi:hypothetical protein